MDNLRDIIKNIIKDNEEIYSQPCVVLAVNKDTRTVDVEPINGDAEIFNVRLQARESAGMGLVLFPKKGSEVIVTFLSNTDAFVTSTHDVEDIILKIDDFEMTIDKENFNKSVKNITIESDNLEHTTKSAKFTTDQVFEVVSSLEAKIKAVTAEIEATTVNIKGVTNITGATTVAGALTVSAAVAMGGGANGGIPKSASLSLEINKAVLEINKIVKAFKDWSPVREDGGAALKTLVGALTELPPVTPAQISNPNATH